MNQQHKQLNLSARVFVVAAGALLLALAAFCDLPLDKAVNNAAFVPAVFMEAYGWVVSYAPAILLLALFATQKNLHFLARFAAGCGAFLGLFVVDYMVNGYLENRRILVHDPEVNILAALCYCLLLLVLLSRAGAATRIRLQFIALFGTAFLVLKEVVINLVKLLWQRTRFDEMLASGSFEAFTPWFRPFGNGGSSLPSGHTAGACAIFILVVLCMVYPALAKYKNVAWGISWVYVIFMAAMRIVIGRHFLSDTVIAALLMSGIFVWMIHSKLFEKYLQRTQDAARDAEKADARNRLPYRSR